MTEEKLIISSCYEENETAKEVLKELNTLEKSIGLKTILSREYDSKGEKQKIL
jgi:hypothetical protein